VVEEVEEEEAVAAAAAGQRGCFVFGWRDVWASQVGLPGCKGLLSVCTVNGLHSYSAWQTTQSTLQLLLPHKQGNRQQLELDDLETLCYVAGVQTSNLLDAEQLSPKLAHF